MTAARDRRESQRKYRERHREEIAEAQRAYRAANPEVKKAYDRAYYQRHREAILERQRATDRNAYMREYHRQYRARKRAEKHAELPNKSQETGENQGELDA